MSDRPEFSRPVTVESLHAGWTMRTITAGPNERAALARRFGMVAVERLQAEVKLRQLTNILVLVEGRFQANVVQTCVITLEDIPVTIEDTFVLTYGSSLADKHRQVEVLIEAEGPPDPLVEGIIDVGEAVAEHLALALDPFPRKPGAEFHQPPQDDGPPPPPCGPGNTAPEQKGLTGSTLPWDEPYPLGSGENGSGTLNDNGRRLPGSP